MGVRVELGTDLFSVGLEEAPNSTDELHSPAEGLPGDVVEELADGLVADACSWTSGMSAAFDSND